MGNVAFVIDHKWAIISILVVLISLCWVLFGKKWSNVLKVFCAGTFSIVIFDILFNWFEFYSKDSIDTLSAGFWNFIILIVSAPVAFVIWHFRDENNRQQIENQRKDINLKEFQKLSEWVSGAHLPEIKTVSKTTQKSSSKDGAEIIEQTTEQSEEYAKKPDTAHFDTFSKRDGAVALQISAIYNLLPFFRGDYGESFRLPAFNLLKSAWQTMLQDSLKKLERENLSEIEKSEIRVELWQKAGSPMGIALTRMLLSLNQENTKLNLRDFPEMLPNICLAGIAFNLNGINESTRDLSGLDLSGVDFRGADLQLANLQNSQLAMAKLQNVQLLEANMQNVQLFGANLQNAQLVSVNLQNAQLNYANFQNSFLSPSNWQNADMAYADLRQSFFEWKRLFYSNVNLSFVKITVHDFSKKIYPDWKKENDSKWEELTKDEQKKVMQRFCDETKMWIYNEKGMLIVFPIQEDET